MITYQYQSKEVMGFQNLAITNVADITLNFINPISTKCKFFTLSLKNVSKLIPISLLITM